MPESVGELEARVRDAHDRLVETGATLARLSAQAVELADEAAGHGWHSMAARMRDVAEALEASAVQISDGTAACAGAVEELGSVSDTMSADEVAVLLGTSTSRLIDAASAVQAAIDKGEEAQTAAAEVGQEGMLYATTELSDRLTEVYEQIDQCHTISAQEQAAAAGFAKRNQNIPPSSSGHSATGKSNQNQDRNSGQGTSGKTSPQQRPGAGSDVPGMRPRPRRLEDYEQQQKWAEESYEAIRADSDSVAIMTDRLAGVSRPSGSTGFTRDEIAQVKDHLFVREQLIEDYETGDVVARRFDPDEEIAAAWSRLRSGNAQHSDLVLLEHELVESSFLKTNMEATYQEAHKHANARYNWQSLIQNG